MKERICEMCKVGLGFVRSGERSVIFGVHAILCQSCCTTMDRRVMATPQWRRHQHLQGSLEVLHRLAQSGQDTRAEVHADMEEILNLHIELHGIICAMLGRATT